MENFFKSNVGSTLISIIWGLGLAALFQRTCKGNNCIVIKGPDPKITRNNIHKSNSGTWGSKRTHDGVGCVQFEPYVVPCGNENPVKDIKQLPLTGYEDGYGYEKYIQDLYRNEYDVAKYKPYNPTPLHHF